MGYRPRPLPFGGSCAQVQVRGFQWSTRIRSCSRDHAFSKFIHGCATLLPHRVDLVPFWLPQSMCADSLCPFTGLIHDT